MSGIILGQSRLSNHTLTTPGATFGVPPQEDFTIRGTSQSWGTGDLALSEIGVNEGDGTAFIRIGGTISQIGLGSYSIVSGPTAAVQYNYNGQFYGDERFTRSATNSNTNIYKTFETIDFRAGLTINETKDVDWTNFFGAAIIGDSSTYSSFFGVTDATNIGRSENIAVLGRFLQQNAAGYGYLVLDSTPGLTNSLIELYVENSDYNGTSYSVILSDSGIKWVSNGYTFSLPDIDGVSGDVMTTDGSGGLYFTAAGGGSPTLTTATISTTNATATTIVQPVIITYSQYGWIVTADVIGRYGYTASYDAKIWAAFKVNSSGLVVQVDTTDKIEKTELSTATSDITTNGYQISLKVTGETGKNIDWKAFYTINIM